MKTAIKKNLLVLSLSCLIFLSFFIGFILDENSAGAGGVNGDFKLIWNNLQLLKNNFIVNLNSPEYTDSRTPAAYILHIFFNPFIETQYQFRLSVFLISLICPIFFFFLLKKKFAHIDKYLILLISSLVLLSPYFRTSAYWGLGENYGILCLLISYFVYQNLNFSDKQLNRKKIFNLFFLTFSSSLCVYFDHKLLIIPLIFFIFVIFNKKIYLKDKILMTFFYFLFSIPFIYLIILWGGILPPDAQIGRKLGFKFNIFNIGYAATIISFYLLPFIFFQKKKIIILLTDFFKKENLFFLFISFFIYLFIILLFSNFSELGHLGKGVAHKVILLVFVNENMHFIATLFSFFFSWVIIHIYCHNNITDKIIIYYFLVISFFIFPIFQEYFDPLILILIFTLFQSRFVINSKNIIILTSYLIFFLLGSNFYYLK